MKPFFSIVLPTFNQANFLKVCLKTILRQTYVNWELLIINNNSTDHTNQFLKNIKDKRINVFNINNKGVLAKSRNLGIKKAKARWICFIDTDDKWFPQKLMDMKTYIDQFKGDLYYHDLVFENKSFLFKKRISDKSKTIKKPIIKFFSQYGNPIGQSSVVVKKSILQKINYISENREKISWEDFDTWIKISKITDKFIRVPIVLGSIWIGPENISNLDRQILNTNRIKKYYYKTFNEFNAERDKNKNLWWLEYPSILKDFRDRNIDSCSKRIKSTTTAPLKFNMIFFYMKLKLLFIKLIREIKKIFTVIIVFKNMTKFDRLYLDNKKYKIFKNVKDLKKVQFKNFKIPSEFFERLKKKNELHCIYQKSNLISYGWSSRNKNFFISEINCKVQNKKDVIFFDFYTIKNFRNKGFYKLLLKKMVVNFKINDCYIYTTFLNLKSIKAIIKSNFKFKNFFTILNKKINLV